MARSRNIRRDLEARGITGDFADALTPRLERVGDRLHPDIYDAVLTGVALAYGEHRRSLDALDGVGSDLEEIQILLTAFNDELQKLDEALEVLAAYATRIRSQSAEPERLLH